MIRIPETECRESYEEARTLLSEIFAGRWSREGKRAKKHAGTVGEEE